MTRDPNKRLGSGAKDATELKEHPFFEDMPWEGTASILRVLFLTFVGILSGDVTAPSAWIPTIASSLDTSQFDKEFTTMLPIGNKRFLSFMI